ncbi:MAG: cation-efflux pump, partial [Oscillospiraceae bacterium]|nr:cation-efflux pump [Oscillospiraceae bacterium]
VGHFSGLMIDGWCGLLVSMFIFKAGWEAAKETISPLLGQKPSEEFVNEIYSLAMSYPEVLGIHDLVVHDYGPSRVMVTLHAEVSAEADILYTHDIIDNIEMQIKEELGCEACIHMDPIAQNDEKINELKAKTINQLAQCLGNDISIHDFRMVEGHTHTNLVFDVVVPYDIKMTDNQVQQAVKNCIKAMDDGHYRAVVTVDHQFV